MLTSGQSFAIDVHSGLALGFAAAQQAGPAREELKQAEAVIQAVDPKPLAPNWYVNLHQPVLFALAPRDAADLVNELLKRDIKDQQIRSNLVRVAAEKLSSAGNDAEAAPLWRELGYSSAPLYSVTSASLRPELERTIRPPVALLEIPQRRRAAGIRADADDFAGVALSRNERNPKF